MRSRAKNLSAFIRENSLQLTMQVFALVVLFLNLWLASKLAPITKDIAVLNTRVQAIEDSNCLDCREFDAVMKSIDKRLDRIERKVDSLFTHE